ncbi:MAG: hypothetical protein LBT74_00750 [Acidobacteriota bacterium]|nr:hypothetical protein [Acidobacteriota bacterium]
MIVDSGDLFNEDEEIPESVEKSAKLKAELFVDIYKAIGIDAVNVGELDLVLGIDYLKELSAKHDFPLVSANLVGADGKPIFKPYVIAKAGGKNIGIMGLMGDTSGLPAKVGEITGGAATVTDAVKAAEAVVAELTGKVDYIIALTHEQANRDWVIARRVKGVNLVVGGHDKQRTPDALETDTSQIVRAGEKGQYQGMFEVDLDDKSFTNELFPYGDDVGSDPKIKAMLTAYNDKVAEMYSGGASAGVNPAANVELRSEKCGMCHADALAKWKATNHAKAYATLVDKAKNYDPKCLSCHTVLFEKPGGFNMTQQQMELVNVQCESCHGDASAHLGDMSQKPAKPTIQTCVTCHDTEDRKKDAFLKNETLAMEKIKHTK